LNVELQRADPQLFKNEFGKFSFAESISMSSHAPGAELVPEVYVRLSGQTDSIASGKMSVDENFIRNMGLTLLRGRNFTDDATDNSRLIIINEVFANKLSPDDSYGALDRVLRLPDHREVRVAGIVKDFHLNLRSPIGNFFFEYD